MAAVPAAPQKAGVELSERDQWAADLDYLARELPARHKSLFFKITPETFQAEVAALKARIPELGRPQFLAGLARLVASVGDSHTALTVMPQKAFPLKLYWFKEGISVIDTTPEYAALLNGRLTAVDGHPVEEVVRAFAGIVPHDNDAQVRDFVPRFLASSEHLFGLGLIADPE
ncbi:MAG: periplasmic protease, partial [Candidatus Aminicenantes bacterium]|nr:periplasmic protease [Candidatus Aminicenantes bacterium]